jgi:tRNA modification GTPase
VGKSTLLNALLNEERDSIGNCRNHCDTIEDELVMAASAFRFIDTAGIRETKDVVALESRKHSKKSNKHKWF